MQSVYCGTKVCSRSSICSVVSRQNSPGHALSIPKDRAFNLPRRFFISTHERTDCIHLANNLADEKSLEVSAYAHEIKVDPNCSYGSDIARAIRNFVQTRPLVDKFCLHDSSPELVAIIAGIDQLLEIVNNRTPWVVTDDMVAIKELSWLACFW